jgi:hypothetical protein
MCTRDFGSISHPYKRKNIMINSTQIKQNCLVVGFKNEQFAIVDHMEGVDTIKLKKDASGQHHYIPLTWVTKVDDKIHVGRTAEVAMKEWVTVAPSKAVAGRGENVSDEVTEKPLNDHAMTEGMKFAASKEGSDKREVAKAGETKSSDVRAASEIKPGTTATPAPAAPKGKSATERAHGDEPSTNIAGQKNKTDVRADTAAKPGKTVAAPAARQGKSATEHASH